MKKLFYFFIFSQISNCHSTNLIITKTFVKIQKILSLNASFKLFAFKSTMVIFLRNLNKKIIIYPMLI